MVLLWGHRVYDYCDVPRFLKRSVQHGEGKTAQVGDSMYSGWTASGHILVPPLTVCVIVDKLLNFLVL